MRDEPQADLETNSWGQPIGNSLAGFQVPSAPQPAQLAGIWCRLEPLTSAHLSELWQAYLEAADSAWTYLAYGPFAHESDFSAWLSSHIGGADPLFFTAIDVETERPLGVLSLMRATPGFATVEVGHIHFSPAMQRTPAATEAVVLIAKHVFEVLGYRRLEWKCDALNAPSRAAAARLGFQYEGLFRKHMIYKQRSRDTAWYSLLDSEWAARKRELLRWLEPSNFGAAGEQLTRLRRVEEGA